MHSWRNSVGWHWRCQEDNIELTKEIRGNESGDTRRNGISNISLPAEVEYSTICIEAKVGLSVCALNADPR